MPKLLNKEQKDYWIQVKKEHFGLLPFIYNGVDYSSEEISIDRMKLELAIARATNIVNNYIYRSWLRTIQN